MKNLGEIGFVLNGGGFAGSLSVGMLKAVIEAGIKPKRIQGVSVGSLNAAKFIESGIEGLEETWDMIDKEGPSSIFNWMDIARTVPTKHSSLFYSKGLLRLISNLNMKKIIEAEEHLEIITCNETKDGQPEIFQSHSPEFLENPDNFRMPIIASTAIPGILPPVTINGMNYSDGVFFQLQSMIDAGCDTIFLFLNDQTVEKNARWDARLAQSRHTLYEKAVIGELKEILRTRKDFQVWTPDDLDLEQKTLPSLVRKMMVTEKNIRSALADAVQGNNINLVPHRIIVIYTETPVKSLYTTGFKRGDIKAARSVGYVQAKNILSKVLK